MFGCELTVGGPVARGGLPRGSGRGGGRRVGPGVRGGLRRPRG